MPPRRYFAVSASGGNVVASRFIATIILSYRANNMESIETSGSALATGSINARFISQNKLDEANDRRDQEWKEAYARWVILSMAH